MGVQGLTTFLKKHPDLFTRSVLHNCTVVIDGYNLSHYLHNKKKLNFNCGGDYYWYSLEVRNHFLCYKLSNITPVVVFRGPKEFELREKMKTFKERLNCVKKIFEGKNCEPFSLVMGMEHFKSILANMEIAMIQTDDSGPCGVAKLANKYNCPVISDSSDFYVMDINKGFIHVSSVTDIHGKYGSNYLYCDLYELNSFITKFKLHDKNIMPLFGSLVGSKHISYDDLKIFYNKIKHSGEKKIDSILYWLGGVKEEHAVGMAKNYVDGDLLNASINFYSVENSTPSIDEQIHTPLKTQCDAILPEKFSSAYGKGQIPVSVINLINSHKLFHRPLVEDLTQCSSYTCSCFFRQVLYGMLLQHSPSNPELHEKNCKSYILEYDRKGEDCISIHVEPIFTLPTGRVIPKLSEMYDMLLESRYNLLAEIIGVNKLFLDSLPTSLQLSLGGIRYWWRNSSPKTSEEFLQALLISVIYFYVLRESCLENDFDNMDKPLAHEVKILHETCMDISSDEKESIKKRIDNNYFNPHIFNNDKPFRSSIVHSYSQLQTCLHFLTLLNILLESPMHPIKYDFLMGSIIYNLTICSMKRTNANMFVEEVLGTNSACKKLFYILLDKVLS